MRISCTPSPTLGIDFQSFGAGPRPHRHNWYPAILRTSSENALIASRGVPEPDQRLLAHALTYNNLDTTVNGGAHDDVVERTGPAPDVIALAELAAFPRERAHRPQGRTGRAVGSARATPPRLDGRLSDRPRRRPAPRSETSTVAASCSVGLRTSERRGRGGHRGSRRPSIRHDFGRPAGSAQIGMRPDPRRRGSSTSRSASPNMLKPKTAREIAAPGNSAIQGAWYMNDRPDPDSIPPHDGYGGGMPKPRNDSPDSARITVPRPIVARMRMVASTLGSTYRSTIRRCPAPSARAAST